MMSDRPLGHLQLAGDFFICEPLSQAAENFGLTLRQAQLHEAFDIRKVVGNRRRGAAWLFVGKIQAADQIHDDFALIERSLQAGRIVNLVFVGVDGGKPMGGYASFLHRDHHER